MFLRDIPEDKAKHYIAGTIAATVGALSFHSMMWQAAILAALAAGILKECADAIINKKATGQWLGDPKGQPHGVEWQDALATALGSVPVALPLLVARFY